MNDPCVTATGEIDARPRATGVSDRAAANAEHIRLTLQRLKQRAEAG